MEQPTRTRIIMPWQTSTWNNVVDNIIRAPINSIVAMDTIISARTRGRIRPRQLSGCFTLYYDQYKSQSQEKFITEIIPMMQTLLKNAPKTFKDPVYVMDQNTITNVALTRIQCATIMTCIWFELFQYDHIGRGDTNNNTNTNTNIKLMPFLTFQNLFTEGGNLFGLACIINYFERIHTYINDKSCNFHLQKIIFKRNSATSLPESRPLPNVSIGMGFIDDSPARMHCISCDESLGGINFLAGSPTQEAVVMLTRPECIVAALLCPRLLHTETITVIGAEKISLHRGIGSSVVCLSSFIDGTPYGYNRDRTEAIMRSVTTFMDASTASDGHSQCIVNFDRDILKAYCGMSSMPSDDVACSNWTYAFNGANMQLRFLQLMIAAGLAGKDMVYHAVTPEFESRVDQFVIWLQDYDIDCDDLIRIYHDAACKCNKLSDLDVFDMIMNSCD